MAKASTTNVTGNREQLLDIISLIEPEMTPVFSMARKKKATSTFPEWQVDSMEEPSFDGVDEGEDVTTFANKRANSARLGNYIQKFRRSYQVSDIQELVDTAGVKSEFAYAKAKSVREMKRDAEAAICSSQDRQSKVAQVLLTRPAVSSGGLDTMGRQAETILLTFLLINSLRTTWTLVRR